MHPEIVHASAVAVRGRGCLITGGSGAGKSTLAFEMIALGATLIADDQVALDTANGAVVLRAPDAIAGMIEARGVGVLRVDHAPAPLSLIVDLDRAESARLPPRRYRHLQGMAHRLILGRGRNGLAAILYTALSRQIAGLE